MNTHLDALEAEAIYIMREVAAECEKPVMLYSIGKDSSVMLHLALKAFYPEKPPFPFLHIDTTWKFKEMIAFRDRIAAEKGIEMLVYTNEEGVKQGTRRSRGQRSAFFPSGTVNRRGSRKTSVRRCGTCTIRRFTGARASGYFRSQTGRRRISGSISRRSRLRLYPYILQRSALSCTGMETLLWWTTTGCVCSLERRSSIKVSVSVHWAVIR